MSDPGGVVFTRCRGQEVSNVISKLNRVPYNPGTRRQSSIEAIKMPLKDALPHRGWRSPDGSPWGTISPIRRAVFIGGTVGKRCVRRYSRWLIVVAKNWSRPGKGGAERKTTQEAASTFLTVTSKRVYWLRRPRSPRSSSTAMDLVE